MNPWDEFAARVSSHIDTDEINVLPTITSGAVTPAIVITPGDPWMESASFSYDVERYQAVCLVPAATPEDGMENLHIMVHAIRDSGGDGWEIGDVSTIRNATLPDDGTKQLGVWVQLSFRNCEHSVEEGS